ncbi:hypothetical protein CSUI_011243 [Cystoisospora suis]|uniref:Transmembrane protein n=1 Tax=Cystoisospora suis TaxID=483139 RepID=A0A2C6KF45_9APIC|nr:hypothetical protein CSUI_011243 [Cystoisospora suis]
MLLSARGFFLAALVLAALCSVHVHCVWAHDSKETNEDKSAPLESGGGGGFLSSDLQLPPVIDSPPSHEVVPPASDMPPEESAASSGVDDLPLPPPLSSDGVRSEEDGFRTAHEPAVVAVEEPVDMPGDLHKRRAPAPISKTRLALTALGTIGGTASLMAAVRLLRHRAVVDFGHNGKLTRARAQIGLATVADFSAIPLLLGGGYAVVKGIIRRRRAAATANAKQPRSDERKASHQAESRKVPSKKKMMLTALATAAALAGSVALSRKERSPKTYLFRDFERNTQLAAGAGALGLTASAGFLALVRQLDKRYFGHLRKKGTQGNLVPRVKEMTQSKTAQPFGTAEGDTEETVPTEREEQQKLETEGTSPLQAEAE